MRWFGPTWDAPINELDEMPVPVGAMCAGYGCGDPIHEGDRGVALPYVLAPDEAVGVDVVQVEGDDYLHIVYHLRCHVQSVLGPGDLLDSVMAGLG